MLHDVRRWLGLKDLVVDAVEDTTNIVQESHDSVSRRTFGIIKLIEPLRTAAQVVETVERLTSATVYTSVRLTNRLVGSAIDLGHRLAAGEPSDTEGRGLPMRSDAMGSVEWVRDSALGVLNGFVGDRLAERGNGLELAMDFRRDGERLQLDANVLAEQLGAATPKVCIFVHGLACTEWSWSIFAEEMHGEPDTCYGSLLARDLGYTPLYLRYNSGLHISENGKRLAALIDELLDAYPVGVQEVTLIGHSMGGLVARSACHYGSLQHRRWIPKLRNVFCIGAPHLGAPLEKVGNVLSNVLRFFDHPGTTIPARILDGRSAGVKDLRFGYVLDEEWQGRDPDALLDDRSQEVPFVDHASYYFIAACITRDPDHPLSKIVGDTLVRIPSAAGAHREPARRVVFELDNGRIVGGLTHIGLGNHPEVYEQIRGWLER